MITAKGLKQTSQSQQSQPTREDYAETEQGKRNIVPLAFLLFLTGCAAYLKSFLPARLEAREAEQAAKQDDADQSDPRSGDDVGVVPDEAAAEEDVAPGNGRTRYSSDNVIPIRPFPGERRGRDSWYRINSTGALRFRFGSRCPERGCVSG